ncbi:MAG: DUF190 domain-containing protein [Armatimonadota bacterium]
MPLSYHVIEIFTSEDARWHGKAAWDVVIRRIQEMHIAARCVVTRGYAGCFENGEVANGFIEVEAFNMPIKIEIVLPSAELDAVLSLADEVLPDGIVAVRELDVRVHKCHSSLIPHQLTVKDVMTASPVSVTEDCPVAEVIRILTSHEFKTLPVVNDHNEPVGIITQNDLITRAGMPVRLGLLTRFEQSQRDTYLQQLSGLTARQVMTHPLVCVEAGKRLTAAVDKMLHHKLKRLPVVDSEGKLVGILARSDIFHTIARNASGIGQDQPHRSLAGKVDTVGEIMDRDVSLVYADTSLLEVVRTMSASGTQRAVVVDAGGKLAGMVFDADLLQVFSEHKAGLWSQLLSHLPLAEIAKRHREYIEQAHHHTAADVMKTDIITIREDVRIGEAVNIMIEHGIKRLPVVDQAGVFLGLVSRDAVLRAGV